MTLQKDITIVGGGVVGMLLAVALARLSRTVLLIEKSSPKNDHRSIVVSYSAVSVLNALGIWAHIKNHVAYIAHIHVSEKRAYGQFHLHKEDEGLPFLGVVVKMSLLLSALMATLQDLQQVELLFDSSVQGVEKDSESHYGLTVIGQDKKQISIRSQLIIAADGTHSLIKNALGIRSKQHDYGQSALVFDLELKRSHQNCAYERFIGDGSIIAILPLIGNNASCVWALQHQQAAAVAGQSKVKMLQLLQQTFGYRLGKFCRAYQPQVFPLSLVQAERLYQGNILLFGNAAHFLHPVSAQGLNLSIRDVAILYDLIADKNNVHLLADNIYPLYAKLRSNDHRRTAMITHRLIDIFSEDAFFHKSLRRMGMHLLQHNPLAKKCLSHLMMGKLNYGSSLMQHSVGFE